MEDRELEREYGWYLIGTNRLGHEAVVYEEFVVKWQEFQDHAELLKTADAEETLTSVDAEKRREMQARLKTDPFVKAVLVGMSEDPAATGG
jgi:hypothetical protein